MKRVAVLDGDGKLVGFKTVKTPKPADLTVEDECDLPTDGSYRWDERTRAFLPVGHVLKKPARPPVSQDYALYLMLRALLDGTPIPEECRQWCGWYRENVLDRGLPPPRKTTPRRRG